MSTAGVGRRRRDRRGPDPAGAGRRRRGDLHLPPGRLHPPVHPRGLDADPAPARGRHHVRLRRADHPDEHPGLPGTLGAAYARLGRALPGRARPADRRAGRPAVPGAVRRGPGRPVRGPAPAGEPGPGRARGRGRGFDGYGIGGALEKENLGTIVGWCAEELPEDRPRHLLGISEPDDIFTAIENGVDTFDCVSPSRVARNAAVYTRDGRFNVNTAASRRAFAPIDAECDCYTCAALHPGLPAPPVQGEGDAGVDAVHDPQRAVHRLPGRPHPGQHREQEASTRSAPSSWAATTPRSDQTSAGRLVATRRGADVLAQPADQRLARDEGLDHEVAYAGAVPERRAGQSAGPITPFRRSSTMRGWSFGYPRGAVFRAGTPRCSVSTFCCSRSARIRSSALPFRPSSTAAR